MVARLCRFKSCYPHQRKQQGSSLLFFFFEINLHSLLQRGPRKTKFFGKRRNGGANEGKARTIRSPWRRGSSPVTRTMKKASRKTCLFQRYEFLSEFAIYSFGVRYVSMRRDMSCGTRKEFISYRARAKVSAYRDCCSNYIESSETRYIALLIIQQQVFACCFCFMLCPG